MALAAERTFAKVFIDQIPMNGGGHLLQMNAGVRIHMLVMGGGGRLAAPAALEMQL